MQTHLVEFVKRAWEAGASIDLTGVGYGREHWGSQTTVLVTPTNYYKFLAGISRLVAAQSILEIGTHWGGSCVAMTRGALQGMARPVVVTVDITTESDAYLQTVPESSMINKIVGDANTYVVCRQIADLFPGVGSIDMLYIDAEHSALPTLLNFGLFYSLFMPKVIVIDDITLNPEMSLFWSLAAERFPSHSANAALIEPMIREQSSNPGFGVIINPQFAPDVFGRALRQAPKPHSCYKVYHQHLDRLHRIFTSPRP